MHTRNCPLEWQTDVCNHISIVSCCEVSSVDLYQTIMSGSYLLLSQIRFSSSAFIPTLTRKMNVAILVDHTFHHVDSSSIHCRFAHKCSVVCVWERESREIWWWRWCLAGGGGGRCEGKRGSDWKQKTQNGERLDLTAAVSLCQSNQPWQKLPSNQHMPASKPFTSSSLYSRERERGWVTITVGTSDPSAWHLNHGDSQLLA